MKVEFLSSFSLDEFKLISNDIYLNLHHIKRQYRGLDYWFEKVLKEIDGIKREIIFIRDKENIKGFIILKNTIEEKKICGIYVKEEFRNNGVGSLLIEEGLKFLKEKKPIITIPLYNLDSFKVFIEKYNWIQTSISYDYNSPEAIFNEKRKELL